MGMMTSFMGDILTTVLVAIMAVLSLYYGARYRQPWKQAQGIMLVFLAIYYLLDVFDLNGQLMRGGWYRVAFDIFCVFSIFQLTRDRTSTRKTNATRSQ